jgi:hypothetical protein
VTDNPRQTLAKGYAESARTHEGKRNHRKAGAHRPEQDGEADRLTTTVGDALPTQVRLALGYQASAREAAEALDTTDSKEQ